MIVRCKGWFVLLTSAPPFPSSSPPSLARVQRYLAENLGEKTDHNNADVSLTKTYKHGHDGITARDGATGSGLVSDTNKYKMGVLAPSPVTR